MIAATSTGPAAVAAGDGAGADGSGCAAGGAPVAGAAGGVADVDDEWWKIADKMLPKMLIVIPPEFAKARCR